MGLEKYAIECNPVANEKAIIKADKYRITILTDALARFEYSPNGIFEDRPTQKVVDRSFDVPEYRVREDGELHIYTSKLEIHYNKREFSKSGLSIRIGGGAGGDSIWYYGEPCRDFLGTARTLDNIDGACELEPGVQSMMGGAVLDDTGSMALLPDGSVEPRSKENIDFYFFGYGPDFLGCLKDFYHLCGKTPLLPRYALGNWWSRYHKYDEKEYKDLMERFEREKIPFSVAVIDMDWHLVDVPEEYGGGWTGYTWNKELFPNPPEFLSWLHDHNMKVTLNVHPADGIRAYEDCYERVAKRMGIDPSTKETVAFDITDEKFINTYFEEVHHPMEEEGVDFWWIDWQQGSISKKEGLDPLWMLNHYHYLDSKWKGNRPMTFSRYAGPGSHRYPIGFSGDSIVTWNSLDFQPFFTVNATNIGYGWWSHDIGGHMLGTQDDELTTRWMQFGVFSPINRLHSSSMPFVGKEPWRYGMEAEHVMKDFLRLRNALIPYLYTMNRYASRDGVPLMLPNYYKGEASFELVYTRMETKNNYYFGSELYVSPITEPMDPKVRVAKAITKIPDGVWYDFFTGHRYEGGVTMNLWRPLNQMPVLAKAGGIVPLKDMTEYDNSVDNPSAFEIKVFPGANGNFTIWEDQGDTPEDLDENWASTELVWDCEGKKQFVINATKGNLSVIPEKRSFKMDFYHIADSKVSVTVDGKEINAKCMNNGEKLQVEIPETSVNKTIVISFPEGAVEIENPIMKEISEILQRAQVETILKVNLLGAIAKRGKAAAASLETYNPPKALLGALLEVLS